MTTENWYEWLKRQDPLIQTVFRAIQSVSSRALGGADITIMYSSINDLPKEKTPSPNPLALLHPA